MAKSRGVPLNNTIIARNWPDRIFSGVILILSIFIFIIIAYPLWFVLIASISNSDLVNLGKVTFYPRGIRFYGYQQIMKDARIWTGYLNTIIYVIGGTLLNIAVTMPAAYALSCRSFKYAVRLCFILSLPCSSTAVWFRCT